MQIVARNVDDALYQALRFFKEGLGKRVSSRVGDTLEMENPVITTLLMPDERVLFQPVRDANPFFHFFEALWMLQGRDDVQFVGKMVKRMYDFSDDGDRMQGAYGWRWRNAFGFDQIQAVIQLLQNDPNTRRAVIAMWSPVSDLRLGQRSRDIPCNTQIYFKLREGRLRMTICNRSNDVILGLYGANAVHMSMLHEYVAGKLNVRMGSMTTISDSFHVYVTGPQGEQYQRMVEAIRRGTWQADPYLLSPPEGVVPCSMQSGAEGWDLDLKTFFKAVDKDNGVELEMNSFKTQFFQQVVGPMWAAYQHRDPIILDGCSALDWAKAGREWLERRVN
jgi:hypothetical protein